MAALTITVADIQLTATTVWTEGTAGETITPMMPIYKASDGEWYKAANTGSTAAAATGLSYGYATDGVRMIIITGGSIKVGATVAAGKIYVVGAAGIIQLTSDNGVGDYPRILGTASSTTLIDLDIGDITPVAIV